MDGRMDGWIDAQKLSFQDVRKTFPKAFFQRSGCFVDIIVPLFFFEADVASAICSARVIFPNMEPFVDDAEHHHRHQSSSGGARHKISFLTGDDDGGENWTRIVFVESGIVTELFENGDDDDFHV
jgi:hypothetical protein